jgi:hypothetical protein
VTGIGYYRYEGFELRTKFSWISGALGSQATEPARIGMGNLGNSFTSSDEALRGLLTPLGVEWHGQAAEAAGQALAQAAQRGGATGTASGAASSAVGGYGQSFEAMRPKIAWEDPESWDWWEMGIDAYDIAFDVAIGDVFDVQSDYTATIEQNRTLDAQANEALYSHEQVSRERLAAFPVVEPASATVPTGQTAGGFPGPGGYGAPGGDGARFTMAAPIGASGVPAAGPPDLGAGSPGAPWSSRPAADLSATGGAGSVGGPGAGPASAAPRHGGVPVPPSAGVPRDGSGAPGHKGPGLGAPRVDPGGPVPAGGLRGRPGAGTPGLAGGGSGGRPGGGGFSGSRGGGLPGAGGRGGGPSSRGPAGGYARGGSPGEFAGRLPGGAEQAGTAPRPGATTGGTGAAPGRGPGPGGHMPFLGGTGAGSGAGPAEHSTRYRVPSTEAFDIELPPHTEPVIEGWDE